MLSPKEVLTGIGRGVFDVLLPTSNSHPAPTSLDRLELEVTRALELPETLDPLHLPPRGIIFDIREFDIATDGHTEHKVLVVPANLSQTPATERTIPPTA